MTEQELPTGWIDTTLGAIAVPKSGKVYPKTNSTLKFLGMDCIEPNALKPHHFYKFSAMKSQASLYADGDVLYGRMRPYLNKVWKAYSSGACSSEFIVFRHSEYIDSDFLKFILHHQSFVNFASRSSSGDRPRVDFKRDLQGYKLWLPPFSEQRRIVSKIEELFSRLDDGEAALRRVQRLLVSYRQAVLKAAVTGELTKEWREANQPRLESGAELLQRILVERKVKWEAANPGKKYELPVPPNAVNAPTIPTSWCWARVKHVGVVQLGRQRAPQYHTGPNMRPYLRVANVYEDRIETGDILEMNFDPAEYERYKLEYGDILLNEGQSPEYLGRPAMYRNEVPGSCFQNTLIRFKAVDGLLPEYALCVFRHYMHSGRFRKLSQITTNIAHLSVGRFVEIEFPLPPMNEQVQIVEEIERRLSSISHLGTEIKFGIVRSASLRQSILKAAFSGQLAPQDPDDEPASALLQRIHAARQMPAARSLTKETGKRAPKQQPTLWEPT